MSSNLEVSRFIDALRDSLVLVCTATNCFIIFSKFAVDGGGGGGLGVGGSRLEPRWLHDILRRWGGVLVGGVRVTLQP